MGTIYVNSGVKKIEKVVKSKGILKIDKNKIKTKKLRSNNDDEVSKNRNIYECLTIEDEDILYADEKQIKSHVAENFEAEFINKIPKSGYEIIMGCSKGKIFYSNQQKSAPVVNVVKTRGKSNLRSFKGESKTVLNLNSHYASDMKFSHGNSAQPSVSNKNIVYTNLSQSSGNNAIGSDMSVGRRPDTNAYVSQLRSFCSNDLNTCCINEQNLSNCVKTLCNNIDRFSYCVKTGTSLKVIKDTLNAYNQVIIEIQKYLLTRSNGSKQILRGDKAYVARATYDFNHLGRDKFESNKILNFLNVLRQRALQLFELNENETEFGNDLVDNEIENNEIYNEIRTIFRTKEHLTLPARSERVISIVLKDNSEQLCTAREIQHGVYVGNCMVKPINNLGVNSILNTREIDIELKEIYLDMKPLSNYNIMSFAKQNETKPRLDEILKKVNLSHLNKEESDSIPQVLN